MRTKQVCNKADKNVENWKEELCNTLQIFPNFITVEEENSLIEEIDPYIKKLRYEHSHWDDVSIPLMNIFNKFSWYLFYLIIIGNTCL